MGRPRFPGTDPSIIYYKTEINSRVVQGERTRYRARIEEIQEQDGTMGKQRDHRGSSARGDST